VKDIVGIILSLYVLKERIEAVGTVIKLWPMFVSKHVSVGIVHVATFIAVTEGCALVLGRYV
jgi:hypothetical protein